MSCLHCLLKTLIILDCLEKEVDKILIFVKKDDFFFKYVMRALLMLQLQIPKASTAIFFFF